MNANWRTFEGRKLETYANFGAMLVPLGAHWVLLSLVFFSTTDPLPSVAEKESAQGCLLEAIWLTLAPSLGAIWHLQSDVLHNISPCIHALRENLLRTLP